jgi:hypothetical protein
MTSAIRDLMNSYVRSPTERDFGPYKLELYGLLLTSCTLAFAFFYAALAFIVFYVTDWVDGFVYMFHQRCSCDLQIDICAHHRTFRTWRAWFCTTNIDKEASSRRVSNSVDQPVTY